MGAQRRREQGITIFRTFGERFAEKMGLQESASDVVQSIQEMM
jgi:hypothetical protein